MNAIMENFAAKMKFLRGQAITNSINAAFQRGCVYAKGLDVNNPGRDRVRRELVRYLEDLVKENYKSGTPSWDEHCSNIEDLADYMTNRFKLDGILRDNRFRIGTAQKVLNLYLKYLWCLEDGFAEPPHCPLDRPIIARTGLKGDEYDWTKLDKIAAYRTIIEQCRELARAENLSLPQWELENW